VNGCGVADMRPDPSILVERFLRDYVPDKGLGQHFLSHSSDVSAVLEPIHDEEGHLFEIGGGPGGLTTMALARGYGVTVIEKDPRAVRHLESEFNDDIRRGLLCVIEGDALRHVPPKNVNWIVGNINYAINSPLLARIDEMYAHSKEHRPCASILIQREVADRLSPSAVGRSRSSLGMVLGLTWDIELGRVISAAKFKPRPAVDGRILVLRPSPSKGEVNNLRLSRRLIRAGFAHRRRKLSNVFERTPNKIEKIGGWNKKQWDRVMEVMLDSSARMTLEKRAEELEVIDWIELAERFNLARTALESRPD